MNPTGKRYILHMLHNIYIKNGTSTWRKFAYILVVAIILQVLVPRPGTITVRAENATGNASNTSNVNSDNDVNLNTDVKSNTDVNLNIKAEACILIDSRTGKVLYGQDADKPGIYPASTTKIMTAILALENGNPDQIMTASQAAVNDIGDGGMNIGIMAGEEISLYYLLHAMLISSANEAANIIAENIAPTREEFISMMNERARELGTLNTNFVNTNGMHHPDHTTTARDMAIMARYAMTFPLFREIVRKESYTMPATNKHKEWVTLYTTNRFLRRTQDPTAKYTVIGIKTGFTTPAGHNLVAAATDNDGMELISVVLGVKGENASERIYTYTKQLFDYGFSNYSQQLVVDENYLIRSVKVKDAKDNVYLDLVTEEQVKAVLPINNKNLLIQRKLHLKPVIEAPVNAGDIIGYIEFWENDVLLGKTNVIAASSIERRSKNIYEIITQSRFGRLVLTIFAIVALFLILRFTLRKISRNIKIKRRKLQVYKKGQH